jgi:hypothetical protein
MLKLQRSRKEKLRHHAIARTLQAAFAAPRPRKTRVAPTGMNSVWSAQFGACPVFGIHVSDFDPK